MKNWKEELYCKAKRVGLTKLDPEELRNALAAIKENNAIRCIIVVVIRG
jgi:hypothetical protein